MLLNYKPNITIGRGTGNDIRMNDISVSRKHAILKLTSFGLILEDQKSKFGSLVLMRNKFPILQDRNNIFLQVGRSVINFSVKANWKYVMRISDYTEADRGNQATPKVFLRHNDSVSQEFNPAD